MSDAIIVAVLALIGTISSGFITARITRDKVMNELKTQNEVQNTKIDHLIEELHKNDAMTQKIPIIEADIKVLDEKLRVANNRIHDLETFEKEFRNK